MRACGCFGIYAPFSVAFLKEINMAQVAIGTKFKLALSPSFSGTPGADIYELTSANWNGISRGEVKSTHMDTTPSPATFGGHTYLPTDIVNPGTLEVEGHFNPDITPPTEQAKATAVVTWRTGDIWTGSAIITDFSFGAPLEEKMPFTCTMQMNSGVTIS